MVAMAPPDESQGKMAKMEEEAPGKTDAVFEKNRPVKRVRDMDFAAKANDAIAKAKEDVADNIPKTVKSKERSPKIKRILPKNDKIQPNL